MLCAYDNLSMPPEWRAVPWKSHSGGPNAERERLFLSPHCLRTSHGAQTSLFEAAR